MRTLCQSEKDNTRVISAFRTLLQNAGVGGASPAGKSISRAHSILVPVRLILAPQAFPFLPSPPHCLVDHYRVPCYTIAWPFLFILACLIPEKAKGAEEAC